MIKNKEIFLRELAAYVQLSDNALAFTFAVHPDIDISSREKFFDNVISLYKRFKDNRNLDLIKAIPESSESELDTWANKDLRIKSVRLKSVRGYPNCDKPYGLDIKNENNEPQSLVLLGSNASGKSSLFDAIEFTYCKRVGEAQLRAYKQGYSDDVRFTDYLEHLNNGSGNIYCKVETMFRTFDLLEENIPKSVRNKVNPDTHFISDYDIYSKGQLDYEESSERSFHNTIAESLGLTELLTFEKNLKAFVLYRRATENRQINNLNKSIDTQKKIIENNEKAIIEKSKYLAELEENQKEIPVEQNVKEVLELLSQIKQVNFTIVWDKAQLNTSIKDFQQAYSEYVSKEIKTGGINELQFLNLGLELLNNHTNCPFCEDSKKSPNEISTTVRSRIKRIHLLNESLQKLTQTSARTFDYLRNLHQQLSLFRSRLYSELKNIREKTEFNELSQLENTILNELSERLSIDFFTEIGNIDDNPNFLKNKNKYLFNLLETQDDDIQRRISELIKISSIFNDQRSELIRKIEQQAANKTQSNTIVERIIIVKKEIKDLETQILTSKSNIEKETKQIEAFQDLQMQFNELKEQSIDYLKVVHQVLNREVENAFAPIKLVVEEILEDYFKLDGRDIQLLISKQPEELDEETGEVLSEIITAQIVLKGSNSPPQSVGKYLNTFHYRLFSTMVGISIAIASRINTGINLPLVLDDIFYASDFENRVRIEEFVKEIFAAFKKYTKNLPLQLILFTHDQMIFESIMKVTQECKVDNIEFAKLFCPSEAKERDNYMNLIYKLPHNLPQKIMETIYI